jgi:hypothetical protein
MNTVDYKEYTINIFQDEAINSPREDDNLGTMICFHKRYDLGDKHDYKTEDFGSWEELENKIIVDNKALIILPLFLYDHSGLSIRTYPHGYHGSWDCGKIGYIFVSTDKVKKEWKVKTISAKLKKTIENNLIAEVETYNDYIQGNIYRYTIEKNGEHIDSCGGYYGDPEDSGLMTDAKQAIDYHIKETTIKHNAKLKAQIKHRVGLEHRTPVSDKTVSL